MAHHRLLWTLLVLVLSAFASVSIAQDQPTPSATTALSSVEPTPTPAAGGHVQSVSGSFYSGSPTTSVLTHLPSRTAASSSIISSYHPTHSAPVPDDTVGEYGPLHVANAASYSLTTYYYYYALLSCCMLFFQFLRS